MFEQYISQIDNKWRDAFMKLMHTIEENLPDGFEKTMQYNMISYVVPLETYPPGYHVTPHIQLPFISIAAQKRHLALYHMGIYTDEQLLTWFQQTYAQTVSTKLNMGKSCIRWTSTKHIPFNLIGELCSKMTANEWIGLYERTIRR